MRSIIVTVGTSLLTNDDRGLPEGERRSWAGWRRGVPLPELSDLRVFLDTVESRRVSAEANTLQALPLREGDALVLLHSQTDDGQRCAQALQEHYQRLGFRAVCRRIDGLQFSERVFAERGLKSLISVVFEEIALANKAGLLPVLCATGGFKAEIAFVNLIGMLMGVEVCYLHELFQELIVFPRFPVDWNLEVVERNLDFLEWLDAEPQAVTAVESRLYQAPELRPFVYDDTDGHSYLTAAGDLLFSAYKARTQRLPAAVWPPASERQPAEKNVVSSVAHHRPDGWEGVVQRICGLDCVQRVSYDAAAVGPGVRILDGQSGTIGVTYERSGAILPLVVETTARGDAQTQLVADYLRRNIK